MYVGVAKPSRFKTTTSIGEPSVVKVDTTVLVKRSWQDVPGEDDNLTLNTTGNYEASNDLWQVPQTMAVSGAAHAFTSQSWQ